MVTMQLGTGTQDADLFVCIAALTRQGQRLCDIHLGLAWLPKAGQGGGLTATQLQHQIRLGIDSQVLLELCKPIKCLGIIVRVQCQLPETAQY